MRGQVVIAMSGGEVIYFELAAAGTLMETEKRDIGGDIVSLDIAPIPSGRQRSRFLAIGSSDSTVRLSATSQLHLTGHENLLTQQNVLYRHTFLESGISSFV